VLTAQRMPLMLRCAAIGPQANRFCTYVLAYFGFRSDDRICPKGVGAMMDPSSKATTKSVGSSKADATQAFRAMAGNGTKETLEKMSAAAAETTSLMQDSCSTAVKGAQDYSAKFVEFARANTEAALEFVQKLSSVKSPSEFFELSTNHSRKQFEILTEQTRELTALAQEVALAATEPLKAGAMKAFNKLS